MSKRTYICTITQSGTSAPVAKVLENTLCGTPEWEYIDEGSYRAHLTGGFPDGSTVIFAQCPLQQPIITTSLGGGDDVYVTSGQDGVINSLCVMVFVYEQP